jgi:hypothetical protein
MSLGQRTNYARLACTYDDDIVRGLMQIINRKSIDAFVRRQCSFKTAKEFMDGHVLTLNKWFRNGAFRISNSCPCIPVPPTFSVNSASFRSASCKQIVKTSLYAFPSRY